MPEYLCFIIKRMEKHMKEMTDEEADAPDEYYTKNPPIKSQRKLSVKWYGKK